MVPFAGATMVGGPFTVTVVGEVAFRPRLSSIMYVRGVVESTGSVILSPDW